MSKLRKYKGVRTVQLRKVGKDKEMRRIDRKVCKLDEMRTLISEELCSNLRIIFLTS